MDKLEMQRREPGRTKGKLTGALVLIGLGVMLLLKENDFLRWREFWPVFLILVGTTIVFSHLFDSNSR